MIEPTDFDAAEELQSEPKPTSWEARAIIGLMAAMWAWSVASVWGAL